MKNRQQQLHLVIVLDQEKGQGCMKKGAGRTSEFRVVITIRQRQNPLTLLFVK